MNDAEIKKKPLTTYMLIFITMLLLTYSLGRVLDSTFNLPTWPRLPWNFVCGFTIFISGLIIGIKSTQLLYSLGEGSPCGEIRRDDETRHLVDTGLYAYSRNPIVIGYSMLSCGIGIIFQSIGMAILIPSLVLGFNILLVKLIEEKTLTSRFGLVYLEYKKRTPFLLPRPRDVITFLNSTHGSFYRNIIVTMTSLFLVAAVTIGYNNGVKLPFQSEATLIFFLLICLFGVIVGLFPDIIKRLSNKGHNKGEFIGHHPPCRIYNNHRIRFLNVSFCAGCTGLVIGAAVSIVITLVYKFFSHNFNSELVFWWGFILISSGLFQHRIDLENSAIHVFLNIVFVTGAALLRIGSEEINGSLVSNALVLVTILYLIQTRINLSSIEHNIICKKCTKPNCNYNLWESK